MFGKACSTVVCKDSECLDYKGGHNICLVNVPDQAYCVELTSDPNKCVSCGNVCQYGIYQDDSCLEYEDGISICFATTLG
jgi:hypothetical protein